MLTDRKRYLYGIQIKIPFDVRHKYELVLNDERYTKFMKEVCREVVCSQPVFFYGVEVVYENSDEVESAGGWMLRKKEFPKCAVMRWKWPSETSEESRQTYADMGTIANPESMQHETIAARWEREESTREELPSSKVFTVLPRLRHVTKL